MEENTCCFVGHREIKETKELREWLKKTVERLITEKCVDTFLFGSKSKFNTLCHETVTSIKKKHSHVKRVCVRAEYPDIDESYERHLLKDYEKTYYPEKMIGEGRAAYVQRNREMIDKSRYCIVYYEEDYVPKTRERNLLLPPKEQKSGTKLALDYARKKDRKLFVFTPEHKKGSLV